MSRVIYKSYETPSKHRNQTRTANVREVFADKYTLIALRTSFKAVSAKEISQFEMARKKKDTSNEILTKREFRPNLVK